MKPPYAELLVFKDLVKHHIKNSKLVYAEAVGNFNLVLPIDPAQLKNAMTNPISGYHEAVGNAMVRALGNENALRSADKLSVELTKGGEHVNMLLRVG